MGEFHGYSLSQALTIVCGPTVFATLIAVKSTRGLLAMSLINFAFIVSLAVVTLHAYAEATKHGDRVLLNVPGHAHRFLCVGGPVVGWCTLKPVC